MIKKPQPGEYSPYAAGYVALAIDTDDIVQLLTDLMESTAALFNSLLADKAMYSYAPGKWTIKQMLGHMIDTERVFGYRALCFARGEQQNLPGFEQDDYEANNNSNQRTLADLVNEFKAVRLANIYFLKSLTAGQANRLGLANKYPATAGAMAYVMAGHELYHLQLLKDRYL